MNHRPNTKIKENRKATILAAALQCFLQFGYSKTSMEDVAKGANISRPLIYSKFKNKEDLYIGVVEHLTEGRFEKTNLILMSNQSKKYKLKNIYEICLIEPWKIIMGKPMSADFYNVYNTTFQELAKKYKCQTLKAIEQVLKDKKISETFILAVEGLKTDLPETSTLRSRLHILIDHFITAE